MLNASSCAGLSLAQTAWTMPPTTMGSMATPGMSMPMPMPVGDGRYFLYLVPSPMAMPMPSRHPTTSAVTAPAGSADMPLESSSAKPAHFTLIGLESSAGLPGARPRRTGRAASDR